MQINSDRFWKTADAITSDCPLCAFLRGFLTGAVASGIVAWLTCLT